MGIRKETFALNEKYHIYNRGTDKRVIFTNKKEFDRFLFLMEICNVNVPLGHVRDIVRSGSRPDGEPLVLIEAYCLNPNHYHLIVEPLVDGGISRFMQKLGTAYVNYFNIKHERSGSLFQGKFKAVHISSESYMYKVYAYVIANNFKHGITDTLKYKSSMHDYFGDGLAQSKFISSMFKTEDSLESWCKEHNKKTQRLLINEDRETQEYTIEK